MAIEERKALSIEDVVKLLRRVLPEVPEENVEAIGDIFAAILWLEDHARNMRGEKGLAPGSFTGPILPPKHWAF